VIGLILGLIALPGTFIPMDFDLRKADGRSNPMARREIFCDIDGERSRSTRQITISMSGRPTARPHLINPDIEAETDCKSRQILTPPKPKLQPRSATAHSRADILNEHDLRSLEGAAKNSQIETPNRSPKTRKRVAREKRRDDLVVRITNLRTRGFVGSRKGCLLNRAISTGQVPRGKSPT